MRKVRKLLAMMMAAMMLVFVMAPTTASAAESSATETSTAMDQYLRQYKSGALTARSIWDPDFYIAQNPDVEAVYGSNRPETYYRHMMRYGIKEGRVVSPFLDLQAYRDANPDLQEFFGNDWVGLFNHFLRYGVYETADGRRGSGGVILNPIVYAAEHPELAAKCKTIQDLVKYMIKEDIASEEATKVLEKQAEAEAAKSYSGGGGSSSSSNSSGSSGTTQPSNPGPSGGGNTENPPVVDPPVVEPDPVAPVDKTVTVSTSSDGSKTTATVNASDVSDAITAAKEDGSFNGVVNVTLDLGNDSHEATETALDAETVAALKEAAEDSTAVTVTVNSKAGNVVLPLEAITQAQGDGEAAVSLEVSKLDESQLTDVKDAEGKAVDLTDAVVVDVTLKVDGNDTPVSGLQDDIQITVDAPTDAKRVTVYFIDETTNKLVRIGAYQPEGDKVSFGVNHLTTFVVEEYVCPKVDGHELLHKDVACDGADCDYVGVAEHVFVNGECTCGATCDAETCPDKANHATIVTTETCPTCGTAGTLCPKADGHAALHKDVACDGEGCDYVGTADHEFEDGRCECGATAYNAENCPDKFSHRVILNTETCPTCGTPGLLCPKDAEHKFGESCDACDYDGTCIRDHEEIYTTERCGYCDEYGSKSTDQCPQAAGHANLMIDQMCETCRTRGTTMYSADNCANKDRHTYGQHCGWCDFDETVCHVDHSTIYTTKTCDVCGAAGTKECTLEHSATLGDVCSECGARTLCADGEHRWQPDTSSCQNCGLKCPETHEPGKTCSVCHYVMPLPSGGQ